MRKYLVLAIRTPAYDQAVVEPHRRFLAELRARDMLQESGPFTDGSGGAYLVLADSLEAAETVVYTDPLHTTGSSKITVHEWEITG
ncbi:YciI family protein [Nocardia sp. NBC_01329]|uniref:YciI family protein n=1 Tax=Nocardia sp. NBC_01329 TaxID=2903594 RepID=UPI002E14443B|nr:YciI family protein [Nocardia sp. NBC_01329]